FTTFVEVMAPCFRTDVLWNLLPTFKANYSSWGMDYVWAELLGEQARVAIVDETQMRHTRPVAGGKLYAVLREAGRSPVNECQQLLKQYRVKGWRFWIRGAVSNSGRQLEDGPSLRFLYALGLLAAIPRLRIHWRNVPRFWLSALWQQWKGAT